MPTIIELGQQVKAKYPQYKDMDDAELGRSVKAKYPGSYDDYLDAPTSGISASPKSQVPTPSSSNLSPTSDVVPEKSGLLQRGLGALVGAGKFIAQDVAGGGAEVNQDPGFLGGLKRFGESVFQSTLGSKGAAGFGQEAAKIGFDTLSGGATTKAVTDLNLSNAGLAEQNTKLIQKIRTMEPGAQRDKLVALLQDNLKFLGQSQSVADEVQGQQGSLRKELTAGANTALTATMSRAAFPSGVPGVAGTSLGEGKILTDVARTGVRSLPVGVLEQAPRLLPTVEKVLSVGKGVIPRAAEQTALGLGLNTVNNIQEKKPIGENAGVAAALSAFIPFAGTAAGAAKEKVIGELPDVAARLINSVIKPLKKDFSYGKDPGRGVALEGITGNSLEDLAPKVTERRQAIGKEIKAKVSARNVADKKLDLTTVMEPLYEALETANKNPRTNAGLIERINNTIQDILGVQNLKLGDFEIKAITQKLRDISPDSAFEFKKNIGDLTKFTGNPSDDAMINKALKQVYGRAKEKLNKAVPGLSDLNERYADLTSADIAIRYRDIINQRQNVFSLGNKVFGIGGAILTALASGGASIPIAIAAATGTVLDKALGSTAVKSRVAAWLARASTIEKEALFSKSPELRAAIERVFGGSKIQEKPVYKVLEKPSFDAAGSAKVPGLFKNLKNDTRGVIQAYKETGNLTTKILKKLEGKDTVSKQFISDLTNSGDLKQTERDIIRQMLETEKGSTVDVAQFADKVKAELLPLKIVDREGSGGGGTRNIGRYENIVLPDEIRGDVETYGEHLFNSPIKTSAGDVHFSGTKGSDNYFGHTRIEDMADNQTRRVIEVQSDLYQKGNLANERSFAQENLDYLKENGRQYKNPEQKLTKGGLEKRLKEVSKLEQYNDPTAHFRMIREEVKKAAQDGKTKLQFPTGETAMKVEGLGDNTVWSLDNATDASPDELKVGEEIYRGNRDIGTDENDAWVITDVLGDGKFKAIPTDLITTATPGQFHGIDPAGFSSLPIERQLKTLQSIDPEKISRLSEQFDISGKVDSNNPIYKFYEKEVGKYLKNKYGAQLVTDKQGVTWWEVPLKKEYGIQPVEAFGKIVPGPLFGGAAAALGAAGVGLFLGKKKK